LEKRHEEELMELKLQLKQALAEEQQEPAAPPTIA
jgi:hypothetical protein